METSPPDQKEIWAVYFIGQAKKGHKWLNIYSINRICSCNTAVGRLFIMASYFSQINNNKIIIGNSWILVRCKVDKTLLSKKNTMGKTESSSIALAKETLVLGGSNVDSRIPETEQNSIFPLDKFNNQNNI